MNQKTYIASNPDKYYNIIYLLRLQNLESGL